MGQGYLLKITKSRIFPEVEEVEIYHDEVYDDDRRPFGHQFLIIPIRSKELFNKILMNKRNRYNRKGEFTINWKKLKNNNRSKNKIAKEWLGCLYEATRNKPFNYRLDGETINAGILGIRIGSIFIDSIKELSNTFWAHMKSNEEKTRCKYETLLRIGIQGVLHFCFNPAYTDYNKIRVRSFFTDGKVFGRIPLDKNRIVGRLTEKCREYIEISEGIKIISVHKSKIKTPEVNFEELTDLILGSTYYLCGKEKDGWKEEIVKPLLDMYNKRERNKVGFESSSHFRAFTITRCKVNERKELNFEGWRVNRFVENNGFQSRIVF